MKRLIFILFILLIFLTEGASQHNLNGRKKVEIPFQFENNFIVVNIRFNKILRLKFIFDTGAEYTVLAKREYADLIGIRYDKEFKIMGADMSTELTAYLARGINLKVGEIENPNQDFLVMGEDYFQFEALTGIPVHGILGANFFSRYVVKIDYRRRIITLYDPQFFIPPKGYQELPISIYKNKAYIQVDSKLFAQDTTSSIKLLVDSGASLTLLVYTDTHLALRLPEKVVRANIGKGLGGFIEGSMGRFHEIDFGGYKLNDLVASYQEIYASMDTSEMNNRNGLLGNMILSRFDIILNYYHQKLYIKPNKTFKKGFKFDRSGIVFLASGKNLNTYTINNVVPGSPAAEVGILKGDQIKKVNCLSVNYLSMENIIRKLQGKVGKRIKLTLLRDGKKFKTSFILREII
jgi:PDZ domain-containing protein/aspartyl protease